MSQGAKKIFLIGCIVIPFLLYCYYYYSQMFKNAPYRFADFQSIVLKYGDGDTLINQYDSKTGRYQYLNNRDSLVVTTVRLRKDDLQYLHGKAANLGFWNLPDDMTAPDSVRNQGKKKSARYFLEFNYKEKSKHVLMDAAFQGNEKMLGTAKSVVDEVQRVLNDAEARK
ncbi:hypothetical protein SAMN05216436_11596 [bacterium A37T11]|nr:hypothetical protein SAMN05216436_11596 [bacterium A37T11]